MMRSTFEMSLLPMTDSSIRLLPVWYSVVHKRIKVEISIKDLFQCWLSDSCEPELEVSLATQGTVKAGRGRLRKDTRSSLNVANLGELTTKKFLLMSMGFEK